MFFVVLRQVDGFHDNTIFEFMGCYFHGHSCRLTSSIKDDKWLQRKQKLYESTLTRLNYFRSLGYAVESIWECEYYDLLESNARARDVVSQRTSIHHQESNMTESQILEAVRDGTFFGAVECDIEVPERLRDKLKRWLPSSSMPR